MSIEVPDRISETYTNYQSLVASVAEAKGTSNFLGTLSSDELRGIELERFTKLNEVARSEPELRQFMLGVYAVSSDSGVGQELRVLLSKDEVEEAEAYALQDELVSDATDFVDVFFDNDMYSKKRGEVLSEDGMMRAERMLASEERRKELSTPQQNLLLAQYVYSRIRWVLVEQGQAKRLSTTKLQEHIRDVSAMYLHSLLRATPYDELSQKANRRKKLGLVAKGVLEYAQIEFPEIYDKTIPKEVKQFIDQQAAALNLRITRQNPGETVLPSARNHIERPGVRSLIDSAIHGSTPILMIAGPPDSGKTSYLEYAAEQVRDKGAVVRVDGNLIPEGITTPNEWYSSLVEQVNPGWLAQQGGMDRVSMATLKDAIVDAVGEGQNPVYILLDNYNAQLPPRDSRDIFSLPYSFRIVAQWMREVRNESGAQRGSRDIRIIGFGYDRYEGMDAAPAITIGHFNEDQVADLARASKSSLSPAEVYELTGGQPLLTQSVLQYGKDSQEFDRIVKNHVMRLARLLTQQPEAMAEFNALLNSPQGTAGLAYFELPGLGIVKRQSSESFDWASQLYREYLPDAVELVKKSRRYEEVSS